MSRTLDNFGEKGPSWKTGSTLFELSELTSQGIISRYKHANDLLTLSTCRVSNKGFL